MSPTIPAFGSAQLIKTVLVRRLTNNQTQQVALFGPYHFDASGLNPASATTIGRHHLVLFGQFVLQRGSDFH